MKLTQAECEALPEHEQYIIEKNERGQLTRRWNKDAGIIHFGDDSAIWTDVHGQDWMSGLVYRRAGEQGVLKKVRQ